MLHQHKEKYNKFPYKAPLALSKPALSYAAE